jgi:DNA-binding transcriptional LysR family regulator
MMEESEFPRLEALRAFLVVIDLGSMSLAAKRLGLSQPTVSQIVRQLETSFGVELIDRSHRPFKATAAGLHLRQRAVAIVGEAQRLSTSLRALGPGKMPAIRIGLVDSFAATVGPILTREVMDMAVQLSVWSGLAPGLGASFSDRELDIVVTSEGFEDVDNVRRYLLLREPFILILPSDAAIRYKRGDLPALVQSTPLIRYSARSHLGRQVDQHLRRIGILAPRRVEVDTSDTLVAMVANGVGWAVTTPLCLLQGRAHAPLVKALPLPGSGFRRQITLVARPGEYAGLPRRIANTARRIIVENTLRDLHRIAPWLVQSCEVGGNQSAEQT